MYVLSHERKREINLQIDEMLLGLGMECPENSIIEICNVLGITIEKGTLAKDVRGLIDMNEGNSNIVINSLHDTPNRRNFTIAHELGHYILHKEYLDSEKQYYIDKFRTNNEDEAIREMESNYFAANILVPTRKLQICYKSDMQYSKIADLFNVSIQVILNRIDGI